jgi:hypothetical protein
MDERMTELTQQCIDALVEGADGAVTLKASELLILLAKAEMARYPVVKYVPQGPVYETITAGNAQEAEMPRELTMDELWELSRPKRPYIWDADYRD